MLAVTSLNGERNAASFLDGERIYLRCLDERDAEGPYPGWLNDEAACAGNAHHVVPYSRHKALEYIRLAVQSQHDVILAIVLKTADRHIGNVALTRIQPLYRCAQFSIFLGDRSEWGKGYGLEAGRLLLRHGFVSMNLARIECGTFATNTAMCKLALALGMKQEGTRRRAAWKNGAYVDVLEFGVLREEFATGL